MLVYGYMDIATYTLQLARQGLNVVLMSRSEEKLNKVATEISELLWLAVLDSPW